MNAKHTNPWMTSLCMASVYIFWGGTYLGMKFAVEQIPPFLMAAARFLIAGMLLYAIARITGVKRPTSREWLGTAPIGILLLVCGNGGIAWAEQYVPSGLAALLVATLPFWITLFNWLIWKGARPNFFVVAGLLLGFGGIGVMVMYGQGIGQTRQDGKGILGIVVCLVAAMCWAFGSSWSRYTAKPSSPLMTSAVQMLSGGVVLAVMSGISGDLNGFHLMEITSRTLLSLGYLIFFGSIIAYNAYVWLLHNANLAMVSTYTYVNPIVAVFLGWAVAGEALDPILFVSAAMILPAVILISSLKDWKPRNSA